MESAAECEKKEMWSMDMEYECKNEMEMGYDNEMEWNVK